jgi:50S ribosomal subunit-associated GTPase HflX
LVDITHANAEEQYATVERTLEELGLSSKQRIVAFNKVDLLTATEGEPGVVRELEGSLRREHPESVLISAGKRWNLDSLLKAIETELALLERPAPAFA